MTGVTLQLARAGFSLLFGSVGVYLASAAKKLFVAQRDWIARGVTAEGEVVAIQTATPTESHQRTFYTPVVTFRPSEGGLRRFTSGMGTASQRYTIGQKVTVRYLPDDPGAVDLDDLKQTWWPLAALVLMTTVCFAIAALPFLLPPPNP